MATTVITVLNPASKPPVATVHAYLHRPAIGSVAIDGGVSIQAQEPQQFLLLADAFLKAGRDLQQQIAADEEAFGQAMDRLDRVIESPALDALAERVHDALAADRDKAV